MSVDILLHDILIRGGSNAAYIWASFGLTCGCLIIEALIVKKRFNRLKEL